PNANWASAIGSAPEIHRCEHKRNAAQQPARGSSPGRSNAKAPLGTGLSVCVTGVDELGASERPAYGCPGCETWKPATSYWATGLGSRVSAGGLRGYFPAAPPPLNGEPGLFAELPPPGVLDCASQLWFG